MVSVKNPNILSYFAGSESLKIALKNPKKYARFFEKITQRESQKRR